MTIGALEIDLDEIEIEERLRPVDPEQVAKIAISFAEQGQITPIELQAREGGGWRVVSGAHRIASAREAGLKAIRAVIFDGTPDQARLREIDENLYRHELSPYDEANFLAERRLIWQRLNGKIKAGRPAARNRGKLAPISARPKFYDETTAKFGLRRDVIKRALRRRAKIDPEVWARLRGSKIGKSGQELDLLARQRPALQAELQREAFERRSSVAEALRRRLPPKLPEERALAVVMAFEKLGTPERAEFWRLMKARKLMEKGK
ncbi:MAG: ParB N-terminal domain-containing protein [Rhodospirillales bacterium]|nr:ParB N-terminal domain-containing protein [Rhodospirillales bacterium]